MAAGSEVIGNDVVGKVEMEKRGLNRVGDVDTVDGNVGGNGKEDSDDYVFVSDGIEVSAATPDDTGGVNAAEIVVKSDLADQVERIEKEELGIENGKVIVDTVVLESNGVVHESAIVIAAEVKGDLDLKNGSTVDSSEVLVTDVVEDVNGHLDKITWEDGEVSESTEEVQDANGEVKADEIVSEVIFDSESTLNPVESSQERAFELESTIKPSEESKSQVTVTQSVSTPDIIDTTDDLESTIKPSEESRSQVTITESVSTPDVTDTTDELLSTVNSLSNTDCEATVHDGPEYVSTVIDKPGCEVTADESDKPSADDVECQVTANGSESSRSPVKEQEDQVTVDESGKPSEDLESQVAGDVPESCESPFVEQECKVSSEGSESIDSLVDNQESPVLVDGPEPNGNNSEEVDSDTIVKDTYEKSEEHHELLNMNSEVNVEAKPNHVCNGIEAEPESESLSTPYPADNKKAERTEIGSGSELQVNPDSGIVLSEEADILANGPVEKFDRILPTGEAQVSETEADGSVPSEKAKLEEMHEKEVEGNSETIFKSTESEETVENIEEMKEQVKIDDEIEESQIVVTDTVQDDLNLEDNTAESANEAVVPLEVETNVDLITHENTASQYEVSNGIDKPEEGFQPEGSAENVEFLPSIDPVPIECKNSDLPVEKANGSHSNPDDLTVVEQEVESEANLVTENRSAENICCKAGIENVDVSAENICCKIEADGSVPSEKTKLKDMHEKEVEGNSETLFKSTESVETVENIEEMKEQVKIDDGIEESQIVVTDTVHDDLILEDNTADSANEAEVPLEVETNVELITHENTASQYEVSNGFDKPEEGFQPEGSAENVEYLPSIDPVPIKCKNSDLLVEKDNGSHSNPDDMTVVEQEVESKANLVTENRSAENICCKTGIENVDVSDDEEKEKEVKDAPVEFVAHLVTDNVAAEVMNCGTEIEDVDVPDEEKTGVMDAPVGEHSTLSFPESYVNPGAVIEFGSIGRPETTPNIHSDDDDMISLPVVANGNTKPSWGEESDNLEQNVDGSHGEKNSDKMSCPEGEDIDGTQSDEIPTSSIEGSVSDVIDVPNQETEVLAYNFLIRIPRFEDESYRDQIRSAQLLVEEKTHIRDAIRVDIQGKRARLRAHNESYNAAKLEETAARRLVRLKRQEIDSVQSVINRWKNAMSVDDIDTRILNTEHMIQHETLDLKDEKQFIREIKQLKTLRDQLASNMGTKEEVRQAIEQKDQTEERMKSLRKELDSLKDKVSKAEAVVKAVGKKYDEENRKERELQAQFRVADEVRQKAYAHLNSLKKLSYDKNKNFRLYKEDAMAARDFVSRGDKEALHHLCANQVEAFMEQWNNNDEFRKEYVSRCNMNASRRQRAFEGNSIVPDDVAPVVLPSNVNEIVGRSLISIPVEAKTVSVVSAGEEGKFVSSTENKHADHNNKSIENLLGQKNPTLKTKVPAKPTLGSDVPILTELTVVTEVIVKKEEENTVTKEETELAKKDEELKKAEIEGKLKEQRRLEEKAKALEALERKKRNAEKAQLKAELRARKEAEQKEKEREKRLRKKEKKANGGDGSVNGEEGAYSESPNEATTKEIEPVKENIKKKTQKPPAHFFSKQLKPKPIPPPLVNRNKKWWHQYGKFAAVAAAAVAILALFLVANTGLFTNLKVTKSSGPV